MNKGLGRHTFNDIRDGLYLMRSELTDEEFTRSGVIAHRTWTVGNTLDQGEEGACVGFAWTHWHNSKPIGYAKQLGNEHGFSWYNRAKEIDPWPGVDYDGTAVRAGADVALERGYINKYLWAASREEIDAWLLNRGPIVVGSYWFRSMDYVTPDNFLRVDPYSGTRGGHAYLLVGKGKEGNYVFQNSWGKTYGDDGIVRMWPSDFEKLLAYGDAEFCTALHVRT